MRKLFSKIIIILAICFLANSCEETYSPKPRGYFKISLPEKAYHEIDSDCPFTFKYPVNSILIPKESNEQMCWYNIDFINLNATLYLSYKSVDNNIKDLLDESRSLAFKHTIKADAIDEELIIFPEKHVYGVIYNIKGNAASATQFFLTDSVRHFLRGSLYFANSPNNDSILPVLNYLDSDIRYLIDSFEWKTND